MPMLGSYLMPRSMCSWMPKPKLPDAEKLSLRNSYSRTFKPLSRISSALAPLTVQWTAIFSLRRMPNDLTVYLAFEKTGCCPVNCSNTLAALVSLSPDSPTQMFRHSLRMCRSRMEFFDLSLTSFFSFFTTAIFLFIDGENYNTEYLFFHLID